MQWIMRGLETSYAVIKGMDPKADWLLGPGLVDYLPEGANTFIPFLVVLNAPKERAVIDQLKNGWPIYIYWDYLRASETVTHFTAFAPLSFFPQLRDDDQFAFFRDADKAIQLCLPIAASALPAWSPGQRVNELAPAPLAPPGAGWPADTVVIGIIDDGVAFAHERFRDAGGGSRVQSFWHQDGPHDPAASTVSFGREIAKQAGPNGSPGIDDLLRTCTVAGMVDEDRLYRLARLIDFAAPGHKAAAWRTAHGTHVLDLAAGEDPADNVTRRPIICVQLPAATTADTSGSDLADKVLHAVDYILDRAKALGRGDTNRPLPVVINLSYGNNAGPHDGTSPLERELDRIVAESPFPVRVVLPAGNHHLGRCHAKAVFSDSGQTIALPWRVQPDDRTPSFLEIWLPPAEPQSPACGRISLSIAPPYGPPSPLLADQHGLAIELEDHGAVLCAARYVLDPALSERGRFLVCLQPTARPAADGTRSVASGIAPSGVWTIRLHNHLLRPDQPAHAWIQRDDTVYGYPAKGRQSYFDQPGYQRYNAQGWVIEDDDLQQPACVVQRDGSISALATGKRTIVAGGFVRKRRYAFAERGAAAYSAGGPVLTPPRPGAGERAASAAAERKPDAVLVSDDSKVHAGVLAAGSRSGAVVAVNGTSVAAPQLARWIADRLALRAPAGRDDVKAEAQRQESSSRHPRPPLPPERGGWGRIWRPSRLRLPRFWD